MKIIGRYVLKEHVGPFVFASTALTSIMLLQYIAKKFGELAGRGLPARVIAEFVGLSVPFTVAMTLPMAVLVAVLYAFSRLAAENEITAMKASGVAMRTVLVPVLLGGVGMSLVMLAFNDQVLPRANHRLAVLQLDIFRTKPTFALREQVINTVKEGQLYLKAAKLDAGGSRMHDVVIYDLSNPLRRRTIYADSGSLTLAANHTDLHMTLHHGQMVEVPDKNPGEFSRLYYRRDKLRVNNVFSAYQESKAGSVSKGDREMSVCEMHRALARSEYQMRMAEYDLAVIVYEQRGSKGAKPRAPRPGASFGISKIYCELLPAIAITKAHAQVPSARVVDTVKTAADSGARPDFVKRMVTRADEPAFQPRIQEARYRIDIARRERNRFDVEIQKKFSLAAACVIFVLIGAPIALRFPRGGVGLVIGVSFAIFGLYYVGLIGGETLADKGYLPPWFAMWAANLVLSVVGVALVSQMGREASTTRGGDFAEILATTRTKVFGWMRALGVPVERRRA